MNVASFNLQNSTCNIFANRKRDSLIKLIRENDIEIIGTQEVNYKTRRFLINNLEKYEILGESRGSIGFTDEFNCILLKKGIFKVIKIKTYSLSENINKKGSKLLFDSFPRICTIVHLIYKNHKFLIINTHLDNVFSFNRKNQLKILSKIIKKELNEEESLIITGDFNMKINKFFINFIKENNLKLVKNKIGSTLRFFPFSKPIDHILVSNNLEITDLEFVKKCEGVYPSDHFLIKTKIKKL